MGPTLEPRDITVGTFMSSHAHPRFEAQIMSTLGTQQSGLHVHVGTQSELGLLDDRSDRSVQASRKPDGRAI